MGRPHCARHLCRAAGVGPRRPAAGRAPAQVRRKCCSGDLGRLVGRLGHSTSPSSATPGITRRGEMRSSPGQHRSAARKPGRRHRVEHRQALPRGSRLRRLPVVPTPGSTSDASRAAGSGRHVLKPSVGAGSLEPQHSPCTTSTRRRSRASTHARLLAAGTTVMVQPYLEAIEQHGETALIFMGNEFSHAVSRARCSPTHEPDGGGLSSRRRSPRANRRTQSWNRAPSPGGGPRWPRSTRLRPRRPGAGRHGDPLLIELELTEPSLFMSYGPASPERFAQSSGRVRRKIERPGARPSAANPASSAGAKASSPDR